MKLRHIRAADIYQIKIAIQRLQEARGLLRLARATKAATYTARAIKSTQGALRHAERCRFAQQQAEEAKS